MLSARRCAVTTISSRIAPLCAIAPVLIKALILLHTTIVGTKYLLSGVMSTPGLYCYCQPTGRWQATGRPLPESENLLLSGFLFCRFFPSCAGQYALQADVAFVAGVFVKTR